MEGGEKVRKKEEILGYTFFTGRIPGRNVISDGRDYAVCPDLRKGISELLFKSTGEHGTDSRPMPAKAPGNVTIIYTVL